MSLFDRALAASALSARQVQIEVTESASLAVVDEATRALQALHARGAEVVLDDFGAACSSFDLIRRLPVRRLKIDRAFVSDLPERRDNAAICEAVVGLARALDLAVTAEGVETEAQFEFLRRLGCASAQGYWIARPLDAADARARLAVEADARAAA